MPLWWIDSRLCADANVVFYLSEDRLEVFGLDDVLNHPKLKKTGPLATSHSNI